VPALVVPTRAPALVVASLPGEGRAALAEAAAAASLGAGAVLTADPRTVTLLARESGLPVVVPVEHADDVRAAAAVGAAACLVSGPAPLATGAVPGLAILQPPEAVLVTTADPELAAAAAAAALAGGARVLAGPAVRAMRRCADVWALLEAAVEPRP
jgi:hypothetical protein